MRVVLIGGGGHASDILGILEAQGYGDPVGLVADDTIDLGRFKHRGVRQWGTIAELESIEATHYVLAIGYSIPRRAVWQRISGSRLEPLTLIHPGAWVHRDAMVGAGTVIMAGAVVSPGVRIGAHGCIHHNSVIGHDCQLADFVTVLPAASVSGDAVLEEACVVGSGAVVIEKRRIGEGTVVGAGAVVTQDLPAGVVAKGAPARFAP